MDEQAWQKWFEGVWADREERVYRAFFGDTGPGIYNIPLETFKSLGQQEVDPRFLTHGVLECPPNERREHWLYVSSGMSNPWGANPETVDANDFSGLGFEFTLHTRQPARWAVQVMHFFMAVQLLVASGAPGVQGELVQYHDRIPLGGSLWKKEGKITQLLVAHPPVPPLQNGYPAGFTLESGKVDLLTLVGITQREAEFATTQSADGLVTLLRHHEVFPLTDPERIDVL